MLTFLPAPIVGTIAAICFFANTIFWCVLLYPFAILKWIIPVKSFRKAMTAIMAKIGETWIAFNGLEMKLMHNIEWDIQGLEGLSLDKSYLVVANHQSWTDIVALQKVFNREIPFLRFFLKQELAWVPFLGAAWWALDFPFMKRYTKDYLEKHPEKRGKDLETTKIACRRFRGSRISVLNFLEGTRFTHAKHRKQNSPYKHLLMPKTGGVAFVLEAMGDQFDSILDVTLYYPTGAVSLWGLFAGHLKKVVVRIERIEIPKELLRGGYLEDENFRRETQTWITNLWQRKDQLIDSLTLENKN